MLDISKQKQQKKESMSIQKDFLKTERFKEAFAGQTMINGHI